MMEHNINDCEFCKLASAIDDAAWWIDEAESTIYGGCEPETIKEMEAMIEQIRPLPVCPHYLRVNRLICTLCGGGATIWIGHRLGETYTVEKGTCDCPLWNEYRDSDGMLVEEGVG